MQVMKFTTGPLETNTYVVSDDASYCLIFDPSSGCGDVLGALNEQKLHPDAIILTHGHFDHLLGIPEIKAQYPDLPVYIHAEDRILLTSAEYNGSIMMGTSFSYNGDVSDLAEGPMTIGHFAATVLHIPGHSPGGCAVVIGHYCLCGDILFAGSVGRADLPGGDWDLLISGIREKLMVLPDDTVICPGHGGRTTIGREKRSNPYVN